MMAGLYCIARLMASSNVTVGTWDATGSKTEPNKRATANAIAGIVLLFIIFALGGLFTSGVGQLVRARTLPLLYVVCLLLVSASSCGSDAVGVGEHFPVLFGLAAI